MVLRRVDCTTSRAVDAGRAGRLGRPGDPPGAGLRAAAAQLRQPGRRVGHRHRRGASWAPPTDLHGRCWPAATRSVWKWRIPYFYCHFTERIQQSGYLRIMEEVVDLFLADRGISIRRMLTDQKWIPVVPQARVEILREALMEEELYTVFTVEDVFKDLTYTARMDCYVLRGDELVQTATGRITHGYALILDRHAWEVVPFDERTLAAFRGEPAPAANGDAPWTS